MGKAPKTEEKKGRTRPDAGDPQGSGDVFSKIVAIVSDGISRAARDAGRQAMPLLETVTSVVEGAMRGAMESKADLVWAAKGVVVGVVRGSGGGQEGAIQTLLHTARAVLRQTAGMGGDVAASAKGLVLGAIASAKDLGVDRERAAAAAAHGAREGAEEAGSEAVKQVCIALKEPIGGVQVVFSRPGAV